MKQHLIRRFLAAAALLGMAFAAHAGEVQVAVAANFAGPFEKLAADFTAATGHTVKTSSGATGKFYAQIQSGAPFEVLFSADSATPAKLVTEGKAVAGTQYTYALGKLVLWSAKPGYVDKDGKVLDGLKYAHIANCNPKTAPYGAAAVEVLDAKGLTAKLGDKLVVAENVAQAQQFVASGNAELGFVAFSQIAIPGKPIEGSYWLVPANLYKPIQQDVVLLKPGEANPAAKALLDYAKSAAGKKVIEAYGYGLKD
jgi:molybdate transport system substrate-binding protein